MCDRPHSPGSIQRVWSPLGKPQSCCVLFQTLAVTPTHRARKAQGSFYSSPVHPNAFQLPPFNFCVAHIFSLNFFAFLAISEAPLQSICVGPGALSALWARRNGQCWLCVCCAGPSSTRLTLQTPHISPEAQSHLCVLTCLVMASKGFHLKLTWLSKNCSVSCRADMPNPHQYEIIQTLVIVLLWKAGCF